MTRESLSLCLSLLAVSLAAAALLLGWADGVGLSGSASVRLALVAAAAGVSAVVLGWHLRRQSRAEAVALHYVDVLSRLDLHELAPAMRPETLPPIDPGSPWYAPLTALGDRICLKSTERAESEHAKASLEIRMKRYALQCERLGAILASLGDPVIAIDRFDELLLANPAAENVLGLRAQDAEHKALSGLVRCEKLVDLLSDTRRRKLATCRNEEIELETAAGERRWFRATVSTLPEGDHGGDRGGEQCHGAVAVLRDVSGLKMAHRRNAEFVSAVSHEMKTPLSGIKAYVELLADGEADDEQTRAEFCNVINGQTDRLQRLIDNLLNLARIEAGVVNVSKKSQSLNDILVEALRVLQPAADGKSINLVGDLSPLYLGVFADRDMLLQAVINLLSNAIKYTPEGGAVTLRSRLSDERVLVEVEDTGVGLSEEDCARVFDKFYRVEKDKGMASGTGLGLALAKHIVEDVHGGQLSLRSQLGSGSTFTIAVPWTSRTG